MSENEGVVADRADVAEVIGQPLESRESRPATPCDRPINNAETKKRGVLLVMEKLLYDSR
jgi:hypothetical protein